MPCDQLKASLGLTLIQGSTFVIFPFNRHVGAAQRLVLEEVSERSYTLESFLVVTVVRVLNLKMLICLLQ